jgi:replicative DNA helicase
MRITDQHLFLHRGPRGSFAAIQEVGQLASDDYPQLKWEIPELDDYVVTGSPGRLYTIVGRPGHGKTTALLHLSHTFEKAASTVGGVVLYASWEVLVEEFFIARSARASGISLFDVGKRKLKQAELDTLESALVHGGAAPFIMFGRSHMTPTAAIPTVPDLHRAVEVLKHDGIRVAAVLVDYLQRIPHPSRKASERREAVAENVQQLKDLAQVQSVPVFMAAQGSRTIDGKKGLKHADQSEIQWSSDAEQTSDTIISITYPKVYALGEEMEIAGKLVTIDESIISMKVIKQRYGPSGKTFLLGVDSAVGRLYPPYLKNAEPY